MMPIGDKEESLLSVSVPSYGATPNISIKMQSAPPSSVSPANTSSAVVSSSAPVTLR